MFCVCQSFNKEATYLRKLYLPIKQYNLAMDERAITLQNEEGSSL